MHSIKKEGQSSKGGQSSNQVLKGYAYCTN